jgi:exosortase/archaeosortase family protein
MSIGSVTPRPTLLHWLSLSFPLGLLGLEIGLLTLTVEYQKGPMAAVARPEFVQAAMIAGTLLLLLCGRQLAATVERGWPVVAAMWFAVNLGSFALLYTLSVYLAAIPDASIVGVLAWIGLALVVGVTALLICATFNTLRTWLRLAWPSAILAVVLGALVAFLTPDMRRSWHKLGAPVSRMAQRILEWRHPGRSILSLHDGEYPIVGLRSAEDSFHGIRLIVTPACSEMESFAVFVLLAVSLLVARWPAASLWRWLAAVEYGLLLLWLLLAARLALLVELGAHTQAVWSQRLAHSRASEMFFLVFSAVWLVGTSYLWRKTPMEKPAVPE